VVVDLSPEDNSVADRQVYRTDFRYDGDSLRLASIAQSDGGSLAFSCVEQDGVYRIAAVSEGGASNPDGSYNIAITGCSLVVWGRWPAPCLRRFVSRARRPVFVPTQGIAIGVGLPQRRCRGAENPLHRASWLQ
jgi:hypothetical protein